MARQRSYRGARRSTPNRSWAGVIDTQNGVASGASVLLGSLALSNVNIDETILRTIGLLSVATDQVASSEQQEGAFGMIVVNDLAIAAGVASVPTPITNVDDDEWLIWVPFSNSMVFGSAIGFDTMGAPTHYFDVKSKRIVQEGFGIAVVVEATAASEGFTFNLLLRQLSMIRGTG